VATLLEDLSSCVPVQENIEKSDIAVDGKQWRKLAAFIAENSWMVKT